jgi:hypothetical protein
LGLDHSPKHTNIGYLKANPQALHIESDIDLKGVIGEYVRTVILNIDDLFNNRLVGLVGIFVFAFFAFGIVNLYKAGRLFDVIFVFLVIIAGLIAPLLHNVVIRHILVIAPIILVVAGIGLYSTIRHIVFEMNIGLIYRYSLLIVIFALVLSVWMIPLNSTLKRPSVNNEYDPRAIDTFVEILKKQQSPGHSIVISARKGYLAYYADSRNVTMPYTDYDKLVSYCKLNDVNYLFLEHSLVHRFPFYVSFENGSYEDDFTLVHETTDRNGQNLSLYRLLSD